LFDPPASNASQFEDMKMNMLGTAALSSLVVAVALAGCSSRTTSTDKHPDQMEDANPAPSGDEYAPNLSAPRTIGRVVTTVAGVTLYTFDDDRNGASTCYDECAKHWPPLIALSTARAYRRMTLTRRTDGQQQWAYDGKPLYTYIDDKTPGDIKGDNVGNAWHVIR
jgi:predicted lipoprotein with Yx(FWY)xxD motif